MGSGLVDEHVSAATLSQAARAFRPCRPVQPARLSVLYMVGSETFSSFARARVLLPPSTCFRNSAICSPLNLKGRPRFFGPPLLPVVRAARAGRVAGRPRRGFQPARFKVLYMVGSEIFSSLASAIALLPPSTCFRNSAPWASLNLNARPRFFGPPDARLAGLPRLPPATLESFRRREWSCWRIVECSATRPCIAFRRSASAALIAVMGWAGLGMGVKLTRDCDSWIENRWGQDLYLLRDKCRGVTSARSKRPPAARIRPEPQHARRW